MSTLSPTHGQYMEASPDNLTKEVISSISQH